MTTTAAANANVPREQEKAMTSAGSVVIPHAGIPLAFEIHTRIPHSCGAPLTRRQLGLLAMNP